MRAPYMPTLKGCGLFSETTVHCDSTLARHTKLGETLFETLFETHNSPHHSLDNTQVGQYYQNAQIFPDTEETQ